VRDRRAHWSWGDATVKLVVVSSDTHVGPLLEEQLRTYCPTAYLEAFDALVAERQAASSRARLPFGGHPNSRTAGAWN